MRGNTISIELPLKRGKVSKTIPLYQYDYGQKLIITGAELPEYYEVHFSNEMHGDAVTSIGDSTGVLIPDVLLATGENVYLWLYLHADSDDGETEFQGAIPVIKRAQVTDQTPTPTEQSVITQAIAALTSASAEATEAKEDAEAAQQHIENMGVAATTLPTGSDATVTKTVDASGEVTLTFGLPRGVKGDRGDRGLQGETGNAGEDGEDGFSPVVSLTKSGKVTTFSVTDAEDTYSVEINDGEDGNPGQDATPDLITVDYSDLTFPVAAGTMCYHSGLLYKANQAIATSEEWTAAHWTQTTIEEEYLSLKTEITNAESDVSDIKSELGLDGTVVDYGTDFPLEITAEEGETVNLTFDTAQSYFVTNKNLFTQSSVTFERYEKYSLPFRLPAGTYTLSALVTTTDIDKTYSNFIIYDGTTAIATYYLERDVRKAKTFTIGVPFDAILFYASDDYSHSSGDTATWADVQLEANGSATAFIAPNGFVESVGEINTITVENATTFIYTDDFSDVTGYGISGATPVIPPMQQAIQKHDGFFTDNNFDGNPGDKYNVFQSPYALSDMVDEAYIASNGSLLTGSSYSVFMVSPLVPVQKSGLYGIKVSKESQNVGNLINSVNGFCFYGQDGTTAISRTAEDLTSLGNDIYTLNVPEGTAFVRFTIYKVADYTQERTLAQFNQWILLPDANSSINDGFFVLSTPKETGYADKIIRSDRSYVKLCSTELHEKKILVFGDSIWGNDRTDGVADFLSKYSGVTIYNCSIGGTWICGDRSDYSGGAAWRAFDGVNLINAKLTDTWTDQDEYVDEVTSYAPAVLALLKTVDMEKVDFIILSYGTNDFSNNKTIAAIKSAYETVISAILTAHPRIRILICTPAWRMFSGTDGDTYQNSNNETTRQMADGIVEMAESNHVESLNMFTSLPWRALTKAYYLDSDEVHPNTEGNKAYAHVVHGKLRSML